MHIYKLLHTIYNPPRAFHIRIHMTFVIIWLDSLLLSFLIATPQLYLNYTRNKDCRKMYERDLVFADLFIYWNKDLTCTSEREHALGALIFILIVAPFALLINIISLFNRLIISKWTSNRSIGNVLTSIHKRRHPEEYI